MKALENSKLEIRNSKRPPKSHGQTIWPAAAIIYHHDFPVLVIDSASLLRDVFLSLQEAQRRGAELQDEESKPTKNKAKRQKSLKILPGVFHKNADRS